MSEGITALLSSPGPWVWSPEQGNGFGEKGRIMAAYIRYSVTGFCAYKCRSGSHGDNHMLYQDACPGVISHPYDVKILHKAMFVNDIGCALHFTFRTT